MALNGRLPEEIELTSREIASPRFTPRELQLLKQQTGLSLSQILGDEATDDKFVALAWFKLRRMGYDVTIEEMGDVVIYPNLQGEADPLNVTSPTGSPASVGTGG